MRLETEYNYGNSQIFAQHDGSFNAKRYFYLHDRLGSVRQVIDTMGNVVNHYTYRPFGELYPAPDFEQTVNNPFKFTGQYYDFEINEYYLRARMYDPHIGRFTARDPVRGKFTEPLTLHAYLYCLNDPVNRTDPQGNFSLVGLLGNRLVKGMLRGAMWGALQSSVRTALDPSKNFELGEFFVDTATGAVKGLVGGWAYGSAWFGNVGLLGKISTKYFLDTFLDTSGSVFKTLVEKGKLDAESLMVSAGSSAMLNIFSSSVAGGMYTDYGQTLVAELGSDAFKFVTDFFQYIAEQVAEEVKKKGQENGREFE